MRVISTFLFSLMVLSFYSCDPCKNLDCIAGNYNSKFRIMSTDGKDLLFGPSQVYDKSKLKFYSISNSDTTFFDYETTYWPNNGYDSVLVVRFFPQSEIAYMKLSDGDIDTLRLSFNTMESRCCGPITEISQLRLNNITDLTENNGAYQIKK